MLPNLVATPDEVGGHERCDVGGVLLRDEAMQVGVTVLGEGGRDTALALEVACASFVDLATIAALGGAVVGNVSVLEMNAAADTASGGTVAVSRLTMKGCCLGKSVCPFWHTGFMYPKSELFDISCLNPPCLRPVRLADGMLV